LGGPEEIRTLDLSYAKAALYQLSYRPESTKYIIKREVFALKEVPIAKMTIEAHQGLNLLFEKVLS
jgi:hypothetical protein